MGKAVGHLRGVQSLWSPMTIFEDKHVCMCEREKGNLGGSSVLQI